MPEHRPWTASEIGRALDAVKSRIEKERRAQFIEFGIPATCPWPSSRLFHEHSSLGPAWRPLLTIEEVEDLTKNLDYKQYVGAERTVLRHPPHITANLEWTIRTRRSECEFSDKPIDLAELAKILELSAGITRRNEIPRRAAPSGGALYPVETYALVFAVEGICPGIYHYFALDHVLEHVRPIPGIEVMRTFFPPRLLEGRPSLMLVFSVVFARTQMKYLERGYRFALLEAGHIAQNALLTATALNLNALCVGGFWDEPFNDLLGFDPSEEAVVYSIILGHAASRVERKAASTRE